MRVKHHTMQNTTYPRKPLAVDGSGTSPGYPISIGSEVVGIAAYAAVGFDFTPNAKGKSLGLGAFHANNMRDGREIGVLSTINRQLARKVPANWPRRKN